MKQDPVQDFFRFLLPFVLLLMNRESFQDLFQILIKILLIPVNKIFQDEMGSCSGFLQAPAMIFYIAYEYRIFPRFILDPDRDLSRNQQEELWYDFISLLIGCVWSLCARILSRIINISEKDRIKYETKSVTTLYR